MKTERMLILSLGLVALGLSPGAEAEHAGSSVLLATGFETEIFTSSNQLELPLKNWFEFAARHREDEGAGDGTGGASGLITEERARSGARALMLELADIRKSRRSEFNLWIPAGYAHEFSVSIWLWFPEDFALRTPGIDWNWMEFCVLASDAVGKPGQERWDYLRLMIHQKDPEKAEFGLSLGGRRGADRTQYTLGKIDDFFLPLGRWFNVHYCLRRDPGGGRVKVWIDGGTVFDFAGFNPADDLRETRITPAKIYHEPGDPSPKRIFVDDLQVWSGWVGPSPEAFTP